MRRLGAVVADQLPPAGGLAGHHHRLPDAGAGRQPGLDLAQLDPEAAHLHLVVGTAAEVQLAVGQPAGQVAGPVHPPAGDERVGQEALRGQLVAPEITARDPGAPEVQLTGRATGHRPAGGVQQVGPHAGQRPADRQRAECLDLRHGPGEAVAGRVDTRLGDAVGVHDRHVRPAHPAQPGGAGHAPDVRAADHRAQLRKGGAGVLPVVQQPVQHGRHDVDEPDPGAAQQREQPAGVQQQLRRAQHQPTTEAERTHQVGGEHVEGEAGQLQVRQPRRQVQRLCPGRGDGRELVVLDQDRLGVAGGTGGVDRVRQLPAARLGEFFPSAVTGRPGPVVGVQPQHGGAVRQGTGQGTVEGGGVGQQQGGRAVGEQVAQPGGGVAGVQRQVAAAGLEHREHRDDQLRAARQADRHQAVGPDAAPAQLVGEPAGAGVELGVAQPPVARFHRHRVRTGLHLVCEKVEKGAELLTCVHDRHSPLRVIIIAVTSPDVYIDV